MSMTTATKATIAQDIQITAALTGVKPETVDRQYAQFAAEVAEIWRGLTPHDARYLARKRYLEPLPTELGQRPTKVGKGGL